MPNSYLKLLLFAASPPLDLVSGLGSIDAIVSDLTTRGIAVAETDFFCDLVRATLGDGRVIARGDIARVIALAARDYVYRGVNAKLRGRRFAFRRIH